MKKFKYFLAISAISSGVFAQDLTMGIVSTESIQSLKEIWTPILSDFEKKTGLKIEPYYAPDYNAVITNMRFKKIQLAWCGNKVAAEMVDRADGEVFAQSIASDGSSGYYSHLIVHKDSPLNSVSDVLKNSKSLSFGNGDPNSTSGNIVPGYYIFGKSKLDPKVIFKSVRNANHQMNVVAVAEKSVDVATNNSENLAKMKEKQGGQVSLVKVIWTSPLIPSDPLVMRKDLPEDVKTKVKDFFLQYAKKDAHEKQNLVRLYGYTGFKVSSNAQLNPIRELDLYGRRVKIELDSSLSDSEKSNRIADIEKQLSSLK